MNWFWSKYDKLNEPYRFFVAMILLSPIWSMNIVIPLSMNNIGKSNNAYFCIHAIFAILSALLGLSRILYFKNNENKKEVE